jgi:hypothetical protein
MGDDSNQNFRAATRRSKLSTRRGVARAWRIRARASALKGVGDIRELDSCADAARDVSDAASQNWKCHRRQTRPLRGLV